MNLNDFERLLRNTEVAYLNSQIKKYCDKNSKKWFYSITATRIRPNKPLIIGFNWGAKTNDNHKPQTDYPKESFVELKGSDLGSLIRVLPYLKKYIPDNAFREIGQSNYCFFRSKSDEQINDRDLRLCRPLFFEFLNVAKPSYMLCFSSRLRDYLDKSGSLESNTIESIPYEFGKAKRIRNCKALKAVYAPNGIPIYFLPHPNYPIPTQVREKAWIFCFGVGG